MGPDQHYLVFKRDGQAPINYPVSVSTGIVQANIPSGASSVFVTNGTERTNNRLITVHAEDTPIFSHLGAVIFNENTQIELMGADFSNDMTITANGKPIEILSHTNSQVTLMMPSELTDGLLEINTPNGQGNTLSYYVTELVDMTLADVEGVNPVSLSLETLLGTNYSFIESNTVTINKFKNKITPVTTYFNTQDERNEKLYLTSYILPTESNVSLDIANASFKYVLDYIGINKIPLSQLSQFKDTVILYPEFTEIHEHLNILLAQSPTALNVFGSNTTSLLISNSNAIYVKYTQEKGDLVN
ncbi:hypothetical protein GCM10009347_41550 [Shewanella algicola]|uniref:IPT/TIG domain-containing protein n=1 Tax=Shewanella algicola TaxID=640633 RepID=A0A9X1ZA37_9GAMM|nr:hypothetical protein [Shewanella algicola]MCL1107767.1 hypothetical protein [Shewanella algicola]GGP72563.1 hypothetical protein GCM10009347_41550 [Shewanella algicola]